MTQRRTFNIANEFPEFNHSNRSKTIGELDTLANNSVRYEGAYRWWTEIMAQTASSFQNFTVASAVLNHACWIGHGAPFTPGVICTSYNGVVNIPFGCYSVNVGITIARGMFIGAGTAIGTGGAPLFNPNASTEFTYDHARWMDSRPIRAVLITGNYGTSGYYESVYISHIRVSGNAPNYYDPSYTQHGIVLAGMGEGAVLDTVEVNTCNGHNVWVTGAGPGEIRYLSSFDANMAGLCFGDLSSPGTTMLGFLKCGFLSFDNNVWGVLCNGGGGMKIDYIKSEDGLSSQRGRPKKGQTVLEAHGWCDIVIDSVRDTVVGASPAAFVINTRANTSRIKVHSYTQKASNTDINSGRSALLMLPRSQTVWRSSDPNSIKLVPFSFEWSGIGTAPGTMTSQIPLVSGSSPAQTRLGLAPTYAGYDYPAGQPPLDLTFGSQPPQPSCTWVVGPWGPWSTCVNGTQTRTRTVESSVPGCIPQDIQPPSTETQTCVAPPPPPPTNGISPSNVTVVVNSADAARVINVGGVNYNYPGSLAFAQQYCAEWGIPLSNIVTVNAGTADNTTAATATLIRNAVQAAGRQFTAMCFSAPSRVGNSQSITSFVTFGPRDPGLLSVSQVFNYTGLTPFTDKGIRPSWLVYLPKYIRRDAHATRPVGQSIMVLGKDSPSAGNPRGSARASQTATGLTVWDMRATAIGGGNNACNWINNGCFLAAFRPGNTPIVAGYQSNFVLGDDGGAVWAKGFYGDHVTSFGGWLPGGAAPSYINNAPQNQTALMYHLERGAAMSVGSIAEPWQGSGGSLSRQFLRVDLFHPRFMSGLPIAVAAWSAVECPDRMLFVGDGMCATFAQPYANGGWPPGSRLPA